MPKNSRQTPTLDEMKSSNNRDPLFPNPFLASLRFERATVVHA